MSAHQAAEAEVAEPAPLEGVSESGPAEARAESSDADRWDRLAVAVRERWPAPVPVRVREPREVSAESEAPSVDAARDLADADCDFPDADPDPVDPDRGPAVVCSVVAVRVAVPVRDEDPSVSAELSPSEDDSLAGDGRSIS